MTLPAWRWSNDNDRSLELRPPWFKDPRLRLSWSRLLVIGLILRIFLSLYGTYTIDFNTWRAWANTLSEVGFANFYESVWCDYLPGYLYVLRGLNWLHQLLPQVPEEILFKLPANLADLGLAILIFRVLRTLTSCKNAQLASLAYFFNPASLANSTFWGQVDSLHTLLIVISMVLGLGEAFGACGIFAALSFMVKPQSVTIVPIFGFFLWRYGLRQPLGQRWRRGLGRGIQMAIAMLLTAWILIWPFAEGGSTLGEAALQPLFFLQERFAAAYNQYTFASFNAFNVWGVIAMRQSDQSLFWGLTYQRWGTLLFGGCYSLVMGLLFLPELRQLRHQHPLRRSMSNLHTRRQLVNRVVDAMTLILLALFLWITRAHERHLLPAVVLLTFTTYRSGKHRWMYAMVSGIYVLNLIYAYAKTTSSYAPLWIDPWISGLVGVLMGVFGLLLLHRIGANRSPGGAG
jgi:hypothetical protein